jgi:2-polyprenyl-6-methoxyphenol hydroxylase-like FAD-dependent oxidoreductase
MDPLTVQILIAFGGVVGAALGAWIAIKVNVAVLESRMERAEEEINRLREFRHHIANKFDELHNAVRQRE